ncbi:MAG TPA: aspartate aminotransferase family protein [Flavobacteriales bacterium]|nr:aspartate aminotransferase family protein [Flavobacteriales bacterium]
MSLEKEHLFYDRLAQTTDSPYGLHLEKAEGSHVWDVTGKKYLDFVAGIAVANVGHRHPKLVRAIEDQLNKYLHTMVYGEYIQDVQVSLADKLTQILPPHLNCTYLVNSGTEANEAALKLAKRHTGRTRLLSFRKSYHGSTHGSLSVSGNEEKKYAFRPLLPEVQFMEFNKIKDLNLIDTSVAAVIIEVIQGDAGVRIADQSFMTELRKKCDESGALLIMDEIQSGMGRTGKMFSFEHYGIFPDILTLAKGFGGGLPIGAMIANKSVMGDFTHKPPLGHITTFGGNPLSCAAAGAVIDILHSEKLCDKAIEKGELFKSLLSHPKIKAIRQIGLMIAVDLENESELCRLIDYCKENGVIIYRFLSHPYSFRISPPLNIDDEDIRSGVKIILEGLEQC